MHLLWHRQFAGLLMVLLCAVTTGCSIGPRWLENNRLAYNEAIKTTTEEQLLLNIVRLRTPIRRAAWR